MINYHETLVSALETVLPTHYELALTANTKTPCISYQERNNYCLTETLGATSGYSRLIYTVKIWSNSLEDLQRYSLEIDNTLRPLGWKRTSSQELYDYQSTMKQKILTYEAIASETY